MRGTSPSVRHVALEEGREQLLGRHADGKLGGAVRGRRALHRTATELAGQRERGAPDFAQPERRPALRHRKRASVSQHFPHEQAVETVAARSQVFRSTPPPAMDSSRSC